MTENSEEDISDFGDNYKILDEEFYKLTDRKLTPIKLKQSIPHALVVNPYESSLNKSVGANLYYNQNEYFYFVFADNKYYQYSFRLQMFPSCCGISILHYLNFDCVSSSHIFIDFGAKISELLGFSTVMFTQIINNDNVKRFESIQFKLVNSQKNRRSGYEIGTFIRNI